MHTIKNIKGSFCIVEFASKKQGKKPKRYMYIEVIKETSNFESIRANINPAIENGKQILYSKTPRNLEE